MIKINYDISNSKRIIGKNNPKLTKINITPIRKYISGGNISNNITYLQDKAFSTISETIFEDAYTLDLVWENNISAEILRWNMSNNVATITKNSTNYSLDKTTNNSSNISRADILTNAGLFFSKPLSFYRATRPTMNIWEGFKPGTFRKSVFDSLKNILTNKPNLPSGNINYDPSTWTGLSSNDVRIINNTTEKTNYINSNRNDPTSSNYIYIDKSVYPNKLLKWSAPYNYFRELAENDQYIIQNDGRWNPSSNTTGDSLDSGVVKYKLNPFFYAKNLDFSGVTAYCSTGDSPTKRTKTGTLITKRHMVHAAHGAYTPSIGTTVRFISKNGNIVNRTVVGRYATGVPDFGMTLLDSDVPDDVAVYKLLPENNNYMPVTFGINGYGYNNYIKNLYNNYIYINFISDYGEYKYLFNQEKQIQPISNGFSAPSQAEIWDANLMVKNIQNTSGNIPFLPNFFQHIADFLPDAPGNHGGVSGDSGSPAFYSYNNTDLVLKEINSAALQSINTINNIIANNLSVPGQIYQAEAIDCSNFESFVN